MHSNFEKKNLNLLCVCRMLTSCWRKELDLVFHIGSYCFFLPLGKIFKGELFASCFNPTMLTILHYFYYIDLGLTCRLLKHILLLPVDSRLPNDFRDAFNAKLLVSCLWSNPHELVCLSYFIQNKMRVSLNSLRRFFLKRKSEDLLNGLKWCITSC